MLAKYSRYPLVANEGRFAGYDVGLSHSGTGRLIRWRSLRSKDDENIAIHIFLLGVLKSGIVTERTLVIAHNLHRHRVPTFATY